MIKTNKDKLVMQSVVGQISSPTFANTPYVISADGKVILLDEEGVLALITLSPEGMTVHSQFQALERYAFAAPTLVGRTLYIRDRKSIIAFDLGPPR